MAREKAPLWERETYVYRYFASDALLYVGITDQWATRREQHRKASPWYRMATHMIVELYADRHQAIAVESWAITYDAPAFNSEAQWRTCPFIVPAALVAFGQRIEHRTWDGAPLPALEFGDGRWSHAA